MPSSAPRKNKQKYHERGFSLAEMLVSIALFSIVVTVTSGTLVVMMNANTKAQSLYSVMTNLSFAVDSMTRNIRTGYEYYCADSLGTTATLPTGTNDSNGSGGCPAFAFTREINGDRVGYRREEEADGRGFIEQKVSNGPWQRITADDVNITRMQFRVYDSTAGDDNQPYVLLRIEGQVDNANNEGAKFLIQTLVTQQILDY